MKKRETLGGSLGALPSSDSVALEVDCGAAALEDVSPLVAGNALESAVEAAESDDSVLDEEAAGVSVAADTTEASETGTWSTVTGNLAAITSDSDIRTAAFKGLG